MRYLALIGMCGCSLYFGTPNGPPEDDVAPPPSVTSTEPDASTMPPCTSCNNAPPPTIYECANTGACSANETDGCGAPLACGQVVSTGSCSCAGGQWSCQPACDDGLCGAAAVQTAITGHWTGTVTPPSFAQPYTIDLWIAADGSWRATSTGADSIPFYYGDNGGAPGEKIWIQAQTSLGAYAAIGLFGGELDGMITALHVDAHHLSFAFVDSWLSCSRTFTFALAR